MHKSGLRHTITKHGAWMQSRTEEYLAEHRGGLVHTYTMRRSGQRHTYQSTIREEIRVAKRKAGCANQSQLDMGMFTVQWMWWMAPAST